jgi:hypothetical protein
MSETRFDPKNFYEFRLDDGAIQAGATMRVLVLSDAVAGPLVAGAVQAGDLTAVRRFGRQLGEQAVSVLEGEPKSLPIDVVVEHAGGTLALFGFGRLACEQWGDALVARLVDAPRLDPDHLGMAALLGGVFSVLSQSEVACVPVDDGERYLVVDPTVAEQVWLWAREGADVARIVSRLSHVAQGEAT